MDTRLVIILLVLALIVFLVKRAGQISAEEAAALLAQGAQVIDVRSPAEFASGHLDGAVNLPLDQIESRIGTVVPDKHQPVLLHCLSGTRSGMARNTLRRLGYTQAHNLGSYSRAASLVSQPGKRPG